MPRFSIPRRIQIGDLSSIDSPPKSRLYSKNISRSQVESFDEAKILTATSNLNFCFPGNQTAPTSEENEKEINTKTVDQNATSRPEKLSKTEHEEKGSFNPNFSDFPFADEIVAEFRLRASETDADDKNELPVSSGIATGKEEYRSESIFSEFVCSEVTSDIMIKSPGAWSSETAQKNSESDNGQLLPDKSKLLRDNKKYDKNLIEEFGKNEDQTLEVSLTGKEELELLLFESTKPLRIYCEEVKETSFCRQVPCLANSCGSFETKNQKTELTLENKVSFKCCQVDFDSQNSFPQLENSNPTEHEKDLHDVHPSVKFENVFCENLQVLPPTDEEHARTLCKKSPDLQQNCEDNHKVRECKQYWCQIWCQKQAFHKSFCLTSKKKHK